MSKKKRRNICCKMNFVYGKKGEVYVKELKTLGLYQCVKLNTLLVILQDLDLSQYSALTQSCQQGGN